MQIVQGEREMYSEDSYHSESEFYYPEEVENKPITASTNRIDRANSGEITSDIQDFILSKRPENTLKKNKI